MAIGMYYALRNIIILFSAALILIICGKLRMFCLPTYKHPANDPRFMERTTMDTKKTSCGSIMGILKFLLVIACLVAIFGIMNLYQLLADLSDRTYMLEQGQEHIYLLEDKVSNCYPND